MRTKRGRLFRALLLVGVLAVTVVCAAEDEESLRQSLYFGAMRFNLLLTVRAKAPDMYSKPEGSSITFHPEPMEGAFQLRDFEAIRTYMLNLPRLKPLAEAGHLVFLESNRVSRTGEQPWDAEDRPLVAYLDRDWNSFVRVVYAASARTTVVWAGTPEYENIINIAASDDTGLPFDKIGPRRKATTPAVVIVRFVDETGAPVIGDVVVFAQEADRQIRHAEARLKTNTIMNIIAAPPTLRIVYENGKEYWSTILARDQLSDRTNVIVIDSRQLRR